MLSKRIKTVLGVILVIGGIAVVTLTAVLLIRLSTDECEHAAIPLNLYIRRVNDNKDLEIWWYEPSSNYECEVTYLLAYWINHGDRVEANVTSDSLTLPSFSLEPCSVVTVELRAISKQGNLNESNQTNTYTEFPRNATVTDIQFSTTDEVLSVTWARPVGVDACDINYRVYTIGELDLLSSLLDREQLDIPHDLYCFNVYIIVFTLNGGQMSAFEDADYEEKEMIQNENFAISPENSQELIISWDNHYKSELCELEYHVVYSSIGIDDQSLNVTEPEAKFNFEYCANAKVTIEMYGLGGTIRGPTYTFDATQWPSTETAAVQDINFGDISNNVLVVSWLLPDYHSYCDIIYTVSAKNPTIDENGTCTGTTECGIRLSDFCPYTEVEIRASSLNGEVVNGKSTTDTYDCTNLHYI